MESIVLNSVITTQGGLMINLKSKKKTGVFFIVVKRDVHFYLF